MSRSLPRKRYSGPDSELEAGISEWVEIITPSIPGDYDTDAAFERGHAPSKESRWWDVYNNEAKKVDNERIKDWRESLNGLLLFAAIFAAVLTAFIIESKKMLEEDASDTILEVLIFYVNNQANGTHAPFEKAEFHPTGAAISISCFLFASLGASLGAALASVLALQWVADYDAAITRGGDSPLDRAKRRQFRFSGVEKWKMSQIIDALPVLIFLGVILFFAGLIQWISELNHTVGYVVVSGATIAALFYFSSTIIAVASAAAPFRTAPARWVYSLLYESLKWSYWRLRSISFTTFIADRINGYLPTIVDSSRGRDDRVIEANPGLERDAYLWVSKQISMSQESYRRWILLTAELPRWTPDQLQSQDFVNGPWIPNLTKMSQNYYDNSHIAHHTASDSKNVSVLVRLSGVKEIAQHMEPQESLYYNRDDSTSEYWQQYSLTAAGTAKESEQGPHPFFLLTRDVPVPSLWSASEMEATIRLSKWRNSLEKGPGIWQWILSRSDTYSTAFMHSALHLLFRYIPSSRWEFGDTENQAAYITLFDGILNWATATVEHSFEWTTEAVRAFGHLVGGRYSYDPPLRYCIHMLPLPTDVAALHASATLIFARSLRTCPPEYLSQRLKEVITMLWLGLDETLRNHVATSAHWNNTILNMPLSELYGWNWFGSWPIRIQVFPCALEILECMVDARKRCEGFGTLWHAESGSNGDITFDIGEFQIFDRLITSASTPAQYVATLDTLCRGFEGMGDGSFISPISQEHLHPLDSLADPYIRIIACRVIGITLPDLLTTGSASGNPSRQEKFWEATEALLGDSLSASRAELIWEVWVSIWAQLSADQKSEWCRKARNHPDRISRIERMSHHPIVQNSRYDTPFNLWRQLLDADLSVGWSDGTSMDIVVVLDDTPLFDGVTLQDQEVLALVACLFYSQDEDVSYLQFPNDGNRRYNQHIRRICEAITASPSPMFTHLTVLFTEMINDSRRVLECAILIKVLYDALTSSLEEEDDNDSNSGPIPMRVLRSALAVLQEVVEPGMVMGIEGTEKAVMIQASRLMAELRYRIIPKDQAVAWPRSYSSSHPVGGWLTCGHGGPGYDL